MMLAAMLLSGSAYALDTYWWGVGPTIGTMAIPTKYPSALPANAKDANGDPLVAKVKGDVEFGVRGVLYPSAAGRVGVRGLVGFGSGWSMYQLTLEYDALLYKDETLQILFGGGLGAGHERFASNHSGPDFLSVDYFPLRAQFTGLLRDRTRAYEISIWGTFHIVGEQLYHEDANDEGTSGSDTAVVAGATYLALGADATVYFGNFKNKGSKKKKK